MRAFVICYIAVSIIACTWQIPVLSYPHVMKVGGLNQSCVEKNNNNRIYIIFLLQWFQHLLRGTKTALRYFLIKVMLHDVIYVQRKRF